MTKPTYEELHEYFTFCPDTGDIRWKNTRRRRAKVGDIAGGYWGNGYRMVTLFDTQHLGHRIAWMMHYGEWPDGEIDHINCVRDDNRISNLRVATSAQNKQNAGQRRDNKSGYRGVSWFKCCRKWRADITANHKQIYLGSFDTIEEAVEAYRKAKAELHTFNPAVRAA